MPVSTETSRSTYATNGVTTAFVVTFHFPANADLVVTYTEDGEDPEVLVLNVDYTVSGAGVSSGGTVTTLSPLATGSLEIKREIDLTQDVNMVTAGPFSPEVLTRALDRAMMGIQQMQRQITDLEERVEDAEAAAEAATTALDAFTAALATASGDIDVAALLASPHTWTAKQTFDLAHATEPAVEIINSGGGPALKSDATGGNGNGIECSGHGSGSGVYGLGGATGEGGFFEGIDGPGAHFLGGTGDNPAIILEALGDIAALRMGTQGPPTGASLKGDVYVDSTGDANVCTADGTPGTFAVIGTQS